MSKRKRFAISQALTKGLSDTINMVENNDGIFHNAVIAVDRLELDPENPRKMSLSIEDVKGGINKSDANFVQKTQELETITRLAETIKQRGLIQPIAVYKVNDRYRVAAGNRRCLAAIIANKVQVEARVFNHKPRADELKVIQWIENTAREDLNLADKLGNLQVICETMKTSKPDLKMTANTLASITGLSLTQAKYYWRVLKSGEQLIQAIQNGWVTSLDKAALIAQIPQASHKEQLIHACQQGKELVDLKRLVKRFQEQQQAQKPLAGKSTARVSLGSTRQTAVVQQIFVALAQLPEYQEMIARITPENWQNHQAVTQAFAKLVKQLETQVRGINE